MTGQPLGFRFTCDLCGKDEWNSTDEIPWSWTDFFLCEEKKPLARRSWNLHACGECFPSARFQNTNPSEKIKKTMLEKLILKIRAIPK